MIGSNYWHSNYQTDYQISLDCSGETDFVRLNKMFELLGIQIIGIQLCLKNQKT